MFVKCLLLLFILGSINARYQAYSYRSCNLPHLENGRIRTRPRTKLIKFICNSRYSLVGNRYATCRNSGDWDVPVPVCVSPGCPPFPKVAKAVQISTHSDAWVHVWCLDGYKLLGSSVTYCNGTHWNTTVPTCIDTKTENQLRCDFEDPNICGWTQDELHDFDWQRLNMQTPSSVHFTGPEHDHTFGKGGSGYYMYIESTSRLENDSARLLSPIYDATLASNGCFSFYYHMFGKSVGGLRVYQKPDRVSLYVMLSLADVEKEKYLLFQQWGNQDNVWYSAAPQLKNFSDSFQIVIEGIRGKDFTSDIAIDDVAILYGENCTTARTYATTPMSFISESCSGRCDLIGDLAPTRGCGCTISCIVDDDCCPDFGEICVFNNGAFNATDDDISLAPTKSTMEMPQTQKLVATTETTSTSTYSTPSIPITPSTPSIAITPSTPSTTTTASTPSSPTIPSTPSTTTTTTTTTTPPIKKSNSTRPIIIPVTPKVIPRKNENSTVSKPSTNNTQIKPNKVVPTPKVTPTVPPKPERIITTKMPIITTSITDSQKNKDLIEQKKKTEQLKIQNGDKIKPVENKSSLKTAIITLVVLAACLCVLWVGVVARSARGRAALARLRARASDDSEVRYLHADDDVL